MRFAPLAIAASAIALSFAFAAPASATTHWDVVGDFAGNANDGTGAWSYGWDAHDGNGFTLFSAHGTCITGGLDCWQSEDPQYFVPLVAKNTTADTLNYLTVVHPTDVLNLHPGGGQDGSVTGGADIDTIVRFTALTAGHYVFRGFFEALDTNPTGVSILAGGNPVAIFGSASHPNSTGPATPFSFSYDLAQGGNVDFVVNRNVTYGNDSTGLSLSVGVPEPATWGLMIMGFGGIGAMLRSNRRRTTAATA